MKMKAYYERIKHLEPEEVFNLDFPATFLIDDEYDKFVEDYPDVMTVGP